MTDIEKTLCRTPNADGTTRIPTWKFDAVRDAILGAIGDAGELAFKDLRDAVGMRLSDDVKDRLGSLAWHVTVVKLELECRGEVRRDETKSPQIMTLGT